MSQWVSAGIGALLGAAVVLWWWYWSDRKDRR
jgi:hypothetical protein